jgi:hypothetical protein
MISTGKPGRDPVIGMMPSAPGEDSPRSKPQRNVRPQLTLALVNEEILHFFDSEERDTSATNAFRNRKRLANIAS